MMTEEILINPQDRRAIMEADSKELEHATVEQLSEHGKRELLSASIKVEPISAECHFPLKAVHYSGVRPLSVIDLIVMHSTEGGSASSNASWFHNRASGGSTQLVVDDYACYRCLRDDQVPWGAPGANYHGFHIEQCGYARWSATLWNKTHRRTLMRAAYKAAFHCRRYGISPRFLTAASLKKGIRNGITTHAECTKAFGGTHTDPGTGWPRLLFMTMVKSYYVTLKKVRKIA